MLSSETIDSLTILLAELSTMPVIQGYHGTKKNNADSILKSKKFQKSTHENLWLGVGVYFFLVCEDAKRWDNSTHVLSVDIKTNSIVDLINDTNDIAEYEKICYSIFSKLSDKKNINRSKILFAVARLMWDDPNSNSPDVVMATFKTSRVRWGDSVPKSERKQFLRCFSLSVSQTQLCVKNENVIDYTTLRILEVLNG